MTRAEMTHFHIDKMRMLGAVRRFFYSDLYIIVMFLCSFIPWFYKDTLTGLYLIMSICTLSLLVNKDITPSLFAIPLMLVTTSTSDFLTDPNNMNCIVVAALLFVSGLCANIIIYKQHLRGGKLTVPLVLVSVALFVGGIGTEYYADLPQHMFFVISLGPLMLALYTISMSCIDVPRDVDRRLYFAKIIALFGFIAALQVLVVRMRLEGDFLENLRDGLLSGWGNRNGFGCLLLIGMGAMFYYADNAKHFNFIYYHLAFALYLALVFTLSRAALIFGTIELFAIIGYLYAKGNHRIQLSVVIVMWIVGTGLAIGLLYDFIVQIIEQLKELGFNSSGRTNLYKEAFQLFLSHPILGVGFGYYGPNLPPAGPCIYWFHDTPLQIMASMGLVGVACYGVYYIARAKMWLSHINAFKVLTMLSIFGFEGQALLDVGPFSSIPFLYLAVLVEIFAETDDRVCDEDKQSALISSVMTDVDSLISSRG